MGKKKRDYKSRGEELFFDFLPDKVYESLSKDEYRNYMEYRRYHRTVFNCKQRINGYENEINRLKKNIQKEKDRLKGNENDDGFELKMKKYYEQISHIDKKFQFKLSWDIRDRSSKSHKMKSGQKHKPSFERLSKTYEGKPIEENIKWYMTIKSVINTYKKTIYLQDEESCRQFLSEIYDEDWSNDPIDYVKDEMKVVVNQYTRYKVCDSNWDKFKDDTHNLDSIREWINLCVKQGIDRYEWGSD